MFKEQRFFCKVCRDKSHWLVLEDWNGDVAFFVGHPITFWERLRIFLGALRDYWRPGDWSILQDSIRVAFTQEDYGDGVSLKPRDLKEVLSKLGWDYEIEEDTKRLNRVAQENLKRLRKQVRTIPVMERIKFWKGKLSQEKKNG